jgi:transcriptional regulator with GAF, ATPase, and Fis domain
MSELLSRRTLADLARAVDHVCPSAIVGFARMIGADRASVLYADHRGIGRYDVPIGELPSALRPLEPGLLHADADTLAADAAHTVGWHIRLAGATRLVSAPVPAQEAPARFWAGLRDSRPLTDAEVGAFEAVAAGSAAHLREPPSPDETDARLRRLEMASGLLPALFRVLDVREVFEQLSLISKEALPHDMLTLGLFNDDLTTITLYAQSGVGAGMTGVYPNWYPPFVSRDWRYDILDDRTTHPLEGERRPTQLGVRSSVRAAIRVGERMVGGLAFMSFEPARYTSADIIIGQRLADFVTVALSHHELAEQARRHEEQRARDTQIELLDQLLVSITASGPLPDVFDALSNACQRVVAHDAMLIAVPLPDRSAASIHASRLPAGVTCPPHVPIPPAALANPSWESEIVRDMQAAPDQQGLWTTRQGFRSTLRLPIRVDETFVAGLLFASFRTDSYSPGDLPAARRIRDRIALSFARERGAALLKRADEATARVSTLELRVRALTEELDARTGYRRVVGESPEWRKALTQATQVAATDTTVLLLGESGTGKEVIARFLHRGSSRSNGPFVALNCAALPEQLLEAELFGYERGAYTGATQSKPGQLEQAAGGTLFLDEVAEMSPPAQAKFLRVLQEREFQRLGGTRVLRTDARIVAATNRDLPRAIAQGQFREDLYYRLNVFAIRLPPLRERRADIGPLSDAFLVELGRGLGSPPAGISRDARQLLVDYHWPGNVRELRNVLERAAILCEGGLITAEHLAINLAAPVLSPAPLAVPATFAAGAAAGAARPAPSTPAAPAVPASAGDLQSMERAMIDEALQRARFNKSKAAKALGLTRQQLYLRMRKYGLD